MRYRDDHEKRRGLIWNDIKPDHLYWDPQKGSLTVIDWGNGFFLDADGTSRDRQHSRMDDDTQFIQAMGEFLTDANPSLLERLDWPKVITPSNAYTDGIEPLKEKLVVLNDEVQVKLQELRDTSHHLYDTSRPDTHDLAKSDELQQQMVAFGELPDSARALNFYARVALQLASAHQFADFQKICLRAENLASASSAKWSLLREIAGLAQSADVPLSETFPEALAGALASGVVDDWSALLWDLFEWIGNNPIPEWWGIDQPQRPADSSEAGSECTATDCDRQPALLYLTGKYSGEREQELRICTR